MTWHRSTDHAGRSCYYLASSGLGVIKLDGLWFIHDMATGENLTFRTTLADAQSVAEFIAGGAR